MPRGKEITIPPPRRGIIYKLPYTDIPSDSVYYAENLYYDITDGGFKKREGIYTLVTGTDSFLSGSYLYDTEMYFVINSGSKIYKTPLVNPSLTNITPSGIASFGKAKYFQYFQTSLYLVMCDGVNKLIRWSKNDTTASVITNSPVYLDAIVQTGRIIGIDNTGIRLTWSSVYDMTTYPATAYIAIPDAERLVALCPLKNDVSVLYGKRSLFLVYSQQGTDATCFKVEKAINIAPEIVNRFCVTSAGGVNFYLSKEKKLYAFDGTNLIEITILTNLLKDMDVYYGNSYVSYNPLNNWIMIGWNDIVNNTANIVLYDYKNNLCAGKFVYRFYINDLIVTSYVYNPTRWVDSADTWTNTRITWDALAVKNNFIVSTNSIYFPINSEYDLNNPISTTLILPPIASQGGDILIEKIDFFIKTNGGNINVYIGDVDNPTENIVFRSVGLKDIDTNNKIALCYLTDRYSKMKFVKIVSTEARQFDYYGAWVYGYEKLIMQREMT